MKKLKTLSGALAVLLAFGLSGAPAFAQDEQPAEPEAATTDEPSDPADAASGDTAPSGEDAPAQE